MDKRIISAYILLLCGTTGMLLRLALLAQGGGQLRAAAASQSIYTLTVGEERGGIYDRNMKPLVNNRSKTVLSVAPSPETIGSLKTLLPPGEFEQNLSLLESGKPLLLTTDTPPCPAPGVEAFSVPIRYAAQQLAPHVIGYVHGDGHGVTGVEKGYDSLLVGYGGTIRTKYLVDAHGGVLGGEVYRLEDSRPPKKGGVVLTLERNIQRLAERAAQAIPKGAVVVMDVHTGEILAMVSCPGYDVNNLAAALEDADGPLFNRATAAYNVGSTFKLCVAAAALEAGYTIDYPYQCDGYYQIGPLRYHCHNRFGHGPLTMEEGMERSCNPYFIDLGQEVGAQRLYNMAYALGFGSATRLIQGVSSVRGSLPAISELTTGQLANFSFGQGLLTATPVQVAQMFSVIGNGGMSVQPTLCRGVTADGAHLTTPQGAFPTRRVLQKSTALLLQRLLGQVVAKGSGKRAAPQYLTAGGKTASAQTGVYHPQGKEIVHGWFAGIYPLESPRYAIVVFAEGGEDGGRLPAEVFREICEGLFCQNSHSFSR